MFELIVRPDGDIEIINVVSRLRIKHKSWNAGEDLWQNLLEMYENWKFLALPNYDEKGEIE